MSAPSTSAVPTASSTTSTAPASTSSTSSASSTSTSSSSSTTSSSTSSSSTSSSTSTSSTSTSTSSSSSTSTTSSSTSTTASQTAPGQTTIFVTSTSTASPTSGTESTTGTSTISSSTGTASATHTGTASSGSGGGLSPGGTIAVAVVVPVASVALIICVLLWWWRRRKANKLAEEERRKEVEEYGFNPNNDPGLGGSVAGGALSSTTYNDQYQSQDGNSGYRGWGTTSHPRKPSTNLSSIPLSETSAMQYSDGPMRPDSGELGAMGAVGVAGAAAGAQTGDIRRGTSNASSAYSAGVHSEGSDDAHMGGPGPNQYYDEGNPYYHDIHNQQAGYGDPAYGLGQPVIRDVQARRNTRIENPGVYPQQGNAGIAQNF